MCLPLYSMDTPLYKEQERELHIDVEERKKLCLILKNTFPIQYNSSDLMTLAVQSLLKKVDCKKFDQLPPNFLALLKEAYAHDNAITLYKILKK